MAQSRWVKAKLEAAGHEVRLIEIKTDGDVLTGPLGQIGGQGLFTKRLQDALLAKEVDLAVHSLKDLPTEDHEGLHIAAVPEREVSLDVLVANELRSLDELPQGATVGTGSVRRGAQLLNLRPDLKIIDIRGNVDTRLKKLKEGPFDAIVLAAAGLRRLGLEAHISYEFPAEMMLPAVGQGCLGLEIRKSDNSTREKISILNHASSFAQAFAERSMLRTLFAGCLAPVGAWSQVNGEELLLTGVVLSKDGKKRVVASAADNCKNSVELGHEVAQQLIDKGAQPLLQDARQTS